MILELYSVKQRFNKLKQRFLPENKKLKQWDVKKKQNKE